MDETGKRRAAAYVAEVLARKGWDSRRLAHEAGIDEGTVRSLVAGERWPWMAKRTAMEKALGLETGDIDLAARGFIGSEPEGDPVEVAIQRSSLSRAERAELIAHYYRLLDHQERRSS